MNLPPNVEGGRRGRRMIWGHEVIVGFELGGNKMFTNVEEMLISLGF